MTTYSKNLTNALSNVTTQHPFFASILYDICDLRENTSVATAATDGATIVFNPDWIKSMAVQEVVFILAHEVLHIILRHMARGKLYKDRGHGPDLKPWNHERFNRAADYIINDILAKAKVGAMPKGDSAGLLDKKYTQDMLADDVYVKLAEQEKDKPPPQPSSGSSHGGFDQHQPPPAAGSGKSEPSEADIQRASTSAKNAAKSMGKLPGNLQRLVEEIINPKKDWKELLQQAMTTARGHDTSSWSKPNRRRLALAPHMILPGATGFQSGGVVVIVDTSGSIGQSELTAFLGEVSGILSEAKPEWCKLLWVDSRVAGEDDIEDPAELLDLKVKGGGGTDMECAFDYISEHGYEPETCVFLTDMYTSFDASNAPDYTVIWCSTTANKEAPYGQTIFIEV